jgi:hypothetical protein
LIVPRLEFVLIANACIFLNDDGDVVDDDDDDRYYWCGKMLTIIINFPSLSAHIHTTSINIFDGNQHHNFKYDYNLH